MKNKLIFSVMALVLILAMVACDAPAVPGSEEAAGGSEAPTPLPPVTQTSNLVSAEAMVVPNREANVGFQTGGTVVELMADEGDMVSAGQTLATLDDGDVMATVHVAEAALAQAEANLAQAKAGATPEQIAIAEAAITRAELALAQALAGPTPEQITVAQARIETLQAQLDQALAGSRPETIQASLARVKQSESAVTQAQKAYDRIAYAADSEIAEPVVQALESATLSYQAVLAEHQALLNGARPEDIAILEGQLAEGEAALQQLLAGASDEDIALAQNGVIEAQNNLNQVQAGATAEQIAVAEAGVAQAQAALEQTKLALDKLVLTAPIDGELIDLNTEVGEIVGAGVPIVSLADLREWQLETDDLTELDVVKVQPGQKVVVTFDALPNEEFGGTVERIKPRSQIKSGDVTYTVVIALDDPTNDRIRWGMTAFVEIDTE